MVYAIEEMKNSRGRLCRVRRNLWKRQKGKKLFYRPAGKRKGMYTPTQIICVSFVIVIALGTFLLSLPVASKHGRLDVLKPSLPPQSPTCVTGLIGGDPLTQFTHLEGGVPLLLLIGGGGVGASPPASSRWLCGGVWASAICGCWEKASQRTDMRRPRTC